MTQREDALKFEQGRIKALQEERLHIQKKTFTKWMNSFLQKARMEVEDLFVDLADGRRLLKLLEIISGERLPRPNSGRMRVHKIENVNKSLSFLHTKVRLESIGAEDIVDGNPRLILGLIWTIILRFQIQEIEIDVDEENESSEKKSAKDALLLWCQRKTSGYHGVHIHNFSDSWRSGLGFNALIHSHRPDLFRWADLPARDHVETLNHAFDVAHRHLGIPKLLDAEDVDTTRPDEKSVMTYVASYYHTFARMKNEQKSGRRIANIIGQLVDCDSRKNEYSRLLTTLLEWIRLKIQELNDRELPNSLDGIQRLLLAFKQYRTVEKPPKYKERSEIEALYFDINTMQKSLTGESWSPNEGQLPHDLERAWQHLEQAEHAREIALRTELLRQQRLEQLNYKFNTKSVLRKGYLKEMIQVLSDPRYGSNLAQVDATVKKHEAISADILARTERFEDLSAMATELVKEKYHGAEAVKKCEQEVLTRWKELLQLLEKHRESLDKLAHLMALLREADAVDHTLDEMKAQFHSVEVGRHLSDVERLLQAHALQELQLGALDESIRRLVRQGNTADGPAQPKKQLADQLKHLEDSYDGLVAAAKDRKARLEDARDLYQFLEDHEEVEGWVTEKQRICRTDVSAKDLRGVLALKQKHMALMHEMNARDHVSQRHLAKGQSLIESKHPKSGEIERRLSSLNKQWDVLRELVAAREKRLADAVEAYQFYGDANEAESWMKEKRPLVGSSDFGSDAPSATALLARHKALHEQINAYSAELSTLNTHANKLLDSGISHLQLPMESSTLEQTPVEEWVNETRLVPTEVWEEEPVERLEHRTVTEERTVPQVKALYPFTGQGISMAKGEVMFLISKSNPDWWSVRKADRSDGFVPANYVREIEPRLVPVQVRRPEKVRSVQRVKKTVLVKQVVQVRKPTVRRTSRTTQSYEMPKIKDRIQDIDNQYDELVKLSSTRREQLEDAIKLFSLFAECDDLDKWIKDKEKMLRSDEPKDTVDVAKRKYEKFVTDLSAASKRLEHIDSATQALVSAKHRQAAAAQARRQQLRAQWDKLLALKLVKERSLEGASSVELFSRTCDEALDWMSEKEEQLKASSSSGADLKTVQALQRRHAQLERELEPLKEKVNTVTLLADSVKSQYPTEKSNVEARQREIAQVWQRCQEQAAERRRRLESAVGHQIFVNSSATLHDWLLKTREQLAQEVTAKDVATAEALHKQHQELMDDIKTREDEFDEVVGLGKKLLANNPTLNDVADKINVLQADHEAMINEWQDKELYLQQCVQLAGFNREADQLDASSGAHEKYLDNKDTGTSVDEVESLLKRHEELEAKLSAQEERVGTFAQPLQQKHYAQELMESRKKAVLSRRDAVRKAASERRRALQASLAHQQFLEAADELKNWIQDKTKTAKDQSYRDLSNLERKLQKHEAFERELQANEKQLRDVENVGQTLQQSASVSSIIKSLRSSWNDLLIASRDKGSKLRQAHKQRAHKRAIEDAKARLVDLERALNSDEIGTDLRSCKRLINQHQALEQELSGWQTKALSLSKAGQELVSDGHFDADAILAASDALVAKVNALTEPAAKRRKALDTSMQLHKYAAEVGGELDWLTERKSAAQIETKPSDLHSAQSAVKKHAKLKAELVGRKPIIEKVLNQGKELVEADHPNSDKIQHLSTELESAYKTVSKDASDCGSKLEWALKGQQLMHEASEVQSWLSDKATALNEGDRGRDRHRATQLLTRHKAVELELDTYAAIISEMKHSAVAMASNGHSSGPALVETCDQLSDNLVRLQRMAANRQQNLLESLCRHEYLAESAELEDWIQEQMAAASSEDYGQDYEHLLILRSKFEELRHRVESGAERFNQCEELAKKLLASESPYIADIEKRQEALGESWQRLVDQIQSRASKLHAAGEIHRFHRDVADLVSRAADKRSQLISQTEQPAIAHRLRDNIDSDLVAIDAQIQVLKEEGSRLSSLYPGGNVHQIQMQQKALDDAWDALNDAVQQRKDFIKKMTQLHRFMTQVRDLNSWCSMVVASMSLPLSGECSSQRAQHSALKAEIDAREPTLNEILTQGADMVNEGHTHSQEISEKCELVMTQWAQLANAWASRQVALDQLSDLKCFLRDAEQLHDLCAAQEAALSTEISPTSSVEEVDSQLKKHEAFEKLLMTQDDKLSTLNMHGDKLLQQNHMESKRIAEELKLINERRKKVYALSNNRVRLLRLALVRAQFAREVGDARSWLTGKLHTLENDQKHGEVSNLEDKIKKLQKHQAFRAELLANEARLKELKALAEQLPHDPLVQQELAGLQQDWKKLVEQTEQRGRGLEEAQDILEFNQNLDKIEAWIRDKEMMVQAHDLGRDYEHCSALLRKLDDVDSDMKVDDKHIKSICSLADKLLKQGPTQQAEVVVHRRDAFLNKWRALTGALHSYRESLTTALDIHAFDRDVQDTRERISSKAASFGSKSKGRDLSAAHELKRRHEAMSSEASAVGNKIMQLENKGMDLAKEYPERAKEIEDSLQKLRENWNELLRLEKERSAYLDEALAVHKFDESLKELELWVSESVKRMTLTDTTEGQDLDKELLSHQEIKAEIDGRQKSITALKTQAEKQLPKHDLADKVQKLNQLSSTLDNAWTERKIYLTQAHQLKSLEEQARQVEDWLAAKEAFLNNDDLGENLDAVEALIRKHNEFTKLLETQNGRVKELHSFAESLLKEKHGSSDYIRKRLDDVLNRTDKLKASCAHRGSMLEQSKQLHTYLRDLNHEREWIALKMELATDQNYRELSNLQSKIQKHSAFESELATNKGRIDDVANRGEELIEANHYASKDIATHVEELENQWRELQSAAKHRRELLQEAFQARVFLRELEDFTQWLHDIEAQLFSEDHGKDLTSATALIKRHARLEQQVAAKSESASQLSDNAKQLAQAGHFMADEIMVKTDECVNRYRQLQEPIQIRRDNLEDAVLLHRWDRDADEEIRWWREKEPSAASTDVGSTLAQAQALQKKHMALVAEMIAREPTVTSLEKQASQLSLGGHFASQQLLGKSTQLRALARQVNDTAEARAKAIATNIDLLQMLLELSEALTWLKERRPMLVSTDYGRDEDSVVALQRRLEATQREITNFDATVAKLDKSVGQGLQNNDQVTSKLRDLKVMYEEMKLLSAKREQRLQQSLKYFKFVQECEETQEWIGEQMSLAASEEYGLDVEHVDNLQQHFDNFLRQLDANEGRIEAVCEAGQTLLEENSPESERVKIKIEDIRGLWEDLKELANARQEALAGARQVHQFDRVAEETISWITEKEAAVRREPAPKSRDDLHHMRRKMEAIKADIDAIRSATEYLNEQAFKLGEQFPDAKEHVSAKLEDVTESFSALSQLASTSTQQLDMAEQLQAYFGAYQELIAWLNETLALVTAPELSRDVQGAERLVARHNDIHAEIRAKDDAFKQIYNDGEKLIKEGHFMSPEIAERIEALRQRKHQLEDIWKKRSVIYAQHLDALVFKRDAEALDNWISSRVPLVRDGKMGDSVSQVEELINRHRDLEETIESQKDRFEALKRITLIEQAFAEQLANELSARQSSLERQHQHALDQYKSQEVKRIEDERRRDADHTQMDKTLSPKTIKEEPTPLVDKLPKTDNALKRAESMQVAKTPKRTPSFTTRRRTQSFRRHQRPDINQLPPVEIEGYVERKQVCGSGGARATLRSWRGFHCVLCGQLLCFFRDQHDLASAKAAAPPVAIHNARCEIAVDYTKRSNVFRLSCSDGAVYLFSCSSRSLLDEWVNKLSFHAQLPPELQLTPYGGDSPTSELRRRLHQNASSSSSANSSPEPRRKHRTQAEILQEHRNSMASRNTPDRIVESSVLPSLPPRQMESHVGGVDTFVRNSEQNLSNWGRSRFSNGRDVNAEFIKSQQEAYAGSTGSNTRPASVAGSTGSPALDQRPASRSSGESELSVSGVPKKDKKGVFGGLFSRKKRPQSQNN